jgi:hypothetical protein
MFWTWLGLSNPSIVSFFWCVCTHPIDPMGIHFLRYVHGNEHMRIHDAIYDIFATITLMLAFMSDRQIYFLNLVQLKCHNPSFGLPTKARGCKVTGQEGNPGVTSHAPGSAKSVREWTLTLPSELPLWELESQMDSRIFRVRLQGPKPIGLKSFLYHWKTIEV